MRTVAVGGGLLDPSVTLRVIESFAAAPSPRTARSRDLELLTPRERDVLGLVPRGLSNAEVVGELYLGEATVKTHVSSLLAKLGLRDRVQAVVAAYETGLVRPGTTAAPDRGDDVRGWGDPARRHARAHLPCPSSEQPRDLGGRYRPGYDLPLRASVRLTW